MEAFGIEFHQLYTITNMPIKRFAEQLLREGKVHEYMEVLVQNFNPSTVDGLMCRYQVSVGWDGQLYDCDFNQMLELGVLEDQHASIFDLDSSKKICITAQSPRKDIVLDVQRGQVPVAVAHSIKDSPTRMSEQRIKALVEFRLQGLRPFPQFRNDGPARAVVDQVMREAYTAAEDTGQVLFLERGVKSWRAGCGGNGFTRRLALRCRNLFLSLTLHIRKPCCGFATCCARVGFDFRRTPRRYYPLDMHS